MTTKTTAMIQTTAMMSLPILGLRETFVSELPVTRFVINDYLSCFIRYQKSIYKLHSDYKVNKQIINNVQIDNYLYNKMSMRPSIKTNIHSTKRGDIQTTMSANLLNKTRSRQMTTKLSRTQAPHGLDQDTTTKISPFLLQSSNNQENQQRKQGAELNAIKNINHEYIQLFHSLFTQNTRIKDSTNILNKEKLTREERYQLQCMKLLKRATVNLERINAQRKVSQDWAKISNYVTNHPQMQSRNQQLKISQQLITKYKSIEQQLKQIEQQHSQLLQKTEENMSQIIRKPDINLSKTQKQYKQTQKKLNKLTNQQQYYMAKFEIEQEELEQLQQKIKRVQQNKLSLQMKVISEKAKKDRLVRKAKEKRQNSLTPAKPIKQQQKTIRSKSSIRFRLTQ